MTSRVAEITEGISSAELRFAEIAAKYREHMAVFPDDWLDYGEADPVRETDRLVVACRHCHRLPHIHEQERREGKRDRATWHIVSCGCGAQAFGARTRWLAWMNWNNSPHAEGQPWREIPFFFVSKLDNEAAYNKLSQTAAHLELRSQLIRAEVWAGQAVGRMFEQRIKAYLAWARYMLRLFHLQTGNIYKNRPQGRDARQALGLKQAPGN